MTKLEQVAQAIGVALYGEQTFRGADLDSWNLSDVLPAARAVMEALRLPDEEMLVAARNWSAAKYGKPVGNDGATGCWQSMCDAILSEKPE